MARNSVLGKLTGPVVVDRAFYAPMNFDHDDVDARKWVFIRGSKRLHLNSYDGSLGKKITDDALKWHNCDSKKMQEIEKEYIEVPVDQCPFAVNQSENAAQEVALEA